MGTPVEVAPQASSAGFHRTFAAMPPTTTISSLHHVKRVGYQAPLEWQKAPAGGNTQLEGLHSVGRGVIPAALGTAREILPTAVG